MTCPSCGYPLAHRYANSCGYCEAYPEVRNTGWMIGQVVQIRSADRYDGMSGSIVEIEPKGYYPYAVALGEADQIVYFDGSEFILLDDGPEIEKGRL